MKKALKAKRNGNFITNFALAKEGKLVKTISIKEEVIFHIPPSKIWLKGRPLSAFHFVQKYNKFYSELDSTELKYEQSKLSQTIYDFLESCLVVIIENKKKPVISPIITIK